MNRIRTRKARKGFTLVELLVVVLILAILMAVALPLYLGAIKNSERATARANMQTIANANQAYRLKGGAYTADIANLKDDLGSATINGPGTRTYTIELGDAGAEKAGANCDANEKIPAGGFGVHTSEASDGCFVPGVSAK